MTPIVIRLKDVAVRVAPKSFERVRVGAEVQLAFVNGEQGRITRVLLARSHPVGAKPAILRCKLRGILVKSSFIRLG